MTLPIQQASPRSGTIFSRVTSLVHQKHRRADDSPTSDCPLLDAPAGRLYTQ